MKAFELYLQQSGYAPSTITEHLINVTNYLQWRAETKQHQADLSEVHEYIRSLQSKNNQAATINLNLRSIELYYRSNQRVPNPVEGIRVQDNKHSFTRVMLTAERLEEIYSSYLQRESSLTKAQQRNSVLLGLLIYQGLSSSDLGKIERQHLQLEIGKIEVPSSRRINGRHLKLEAVQILTLQSYLSHIPIERTALLFNDLDNKLCFLLKELKRQFPEIKHLRLLRQSRIIHWLKVCHVREVQYRAGFKHISTVEDYQSQDLESLKEELQKHHPLQ